MERDKKGYSGGSGTTKKKVTEAIAKAESNRSAITRYLSRSGCHPCDRSEAGYQLGIINKKIDALNVSLSRLQSFDD